MKHIETDITNCARCGSDHPQLRFRPFDQPPKDITHWAPCPRTGDPVLLVVAPNAEPKPQ